ncbi:MAG TPA: hypothetical protein VMJ11_26105 [Paraburkholderia sp.]|nr:hypothetical protein [Paraburkholderia sp.]HTR10062.1 hypothetical protein [Paraburkholderia sp.]
MIDAPGRYVEYAVLSRVGMAAIAAIAAVAEEIAQKRRMTLEELVRELLDHDRAHGLELEELESELLESARA